MRKKSIVIVSTLVRLQCNCVLRHEPQDSNRFDVCRLRKQVEPSQTFQHVLAPDLPLRLLLCRPRDDLPDVPRLRVRITADIHDDLRAKGKQLAHERLVAPLARRVDDERGVGGRKVANGAEDLRRVARAEGYFVREAVERRVVRRETDRVSGELDACDLGEVRGERQREEACTAVGVHEVSRGRGA